MRFSLKGALKTTSAISIATIISFTTVAGAQAQTQASQAEQVAAETEAAIKDYMPELNDADINELSDWYGQLDEQPTMPEDFYAVPTELPSANGQIIKSIDLNPNYGFTLAVPQPVATAQKIMYKSTDYKGQPVAITGTLFEPQAAWKGKGERPVIVFAPGTQGLGDPCAPSQQIEAGTEYEATALISLLNSGYTVVMTDYLGSGTEGTHSYLNRVDQANAVLDSARAVTDAGLSSSSAPVGIWGYSQGGGAAAAAAELQTSYAPELKVKGVMAGAAPADLGAVMNKIDGTTYNGFMLMGLAGLGDSYGVDYSQYLNKKGIETAERIREICTGDALKEFGSIRNTGMYTLSGQKMSQVMKNSPELQHILDENALGQEGRHPSAPTLIVSSVADDVIPHKSNRKLANSYCQAGTRVSFYAPLTLIHAVGGIAAIPRGLIFMDRQFKGLPNSNECWVVQGG